MNSMAVAEIQAKELTNYVSNGIVGQAMIGDPANPDFMTIDGFLVNGNFEGKVVGEDLLGMNVKWIDDVRIDGDADANFEIIDSLPTSTAGVNTQPLIIGGTFESGNAITLPLTGLTSQIIIGNWAGDVVVGSTTLNNGYADKAGGLGGGSVGDVPFELHEEDCDPNIGECVARENADDEGQLLTIEMHHYGPVTCPTSDDPFTIERRAIGSNDPTAWKDHTACFSEIRSSANHNVFELTPDDETGESTLGLEAGFEYRVTLAQNASNENILRCDLGAQEPEVADHGEVYIFSVGELSLGDANNDGTVKFNDITSVLGNWGTTDCLTEGDANRDGVVDDDDNTAVNENWLMTYNSCTGPSTQSLLFPGACDRTMEDAIAAMGFTSAS